MTKMIGMKTLDDLKARRARSSAKNKKLMKILGKKTTIVLSATMT